MATPNSLPAISASPSKPVTPAQDATGTGLSSEEARRRLQKDGPNAMPDTTLHPLRRALHKFWAPVPWMLESAIVLELVLGKYVEAAIIAALLAFNALLGLLQESRAQATLAALKSRLALNASVRRDGVWKTIPAAELVVGDLVKLSLGGVVAADVTLIAGEVLLDQSMLTGSHRSWCGRSDIRRRTGTSRRGNSRCHCNGSAHKIRPHRRARAHRSRR
jgi:H+-transporting ATPase